MPSEGSDEGTTGGTGGGGSGPRDDSLSNRADGWLSSNGLYVEAALAVVALAVGVLAVPFVTFGALTAIGGEASILAVGAAVAVASVGLLSALATLLLVHGYLEFRRRGPTLARGENAQSLAYRGTRLAETLAAGAFLVGLTAALAAALSIGTVPPPVLLVAVAAGLSMPVTVILHAVGAAIAAIAGAG